ncbi:GNAT family N-acetyltransferase [Moritella sp. F3]|uniref:GNAT family N-acetyltransferase n=1 Tax=Moritella sp. F3 TaxID=2718882 RepID=UPI0018E18670|nr:GNAT family N-acetyltransferase [Moritella sp. F3]GIC78633.1 N-acetyltransferase [Moritella sp. F1]GIC79828.1 N-acetyltransferase [Moritella sp. F3]
METERIKLISPSLEVVAAMWEAIEESRTELSKYLLWVASVNSELDLKRNIQLAIDNFEQFHGEFLFPIIKCSDNRFLGVIGFMVTDRQAKLYEIGYWLRSSETGNGYVAEAISIIENYAFNHHCASYVEIRVAESNSKSRLVAERCDYELESTLINERTLPSGELDNTVVYRKRNL